jgi:hypothetical protein
MVANDLTILGFHGYCTSPSLIYKLLDPCSLLHNQLTPWPYHALRLAHEVACDVYSRRFAPLLIYWEEKPPLLVFTDCRYLASILK